MFLPRVLALALLVPLALPAPPAAAAAPPAALVKDVATGQPLPYLPNLRDRVDFVLLGERLYFSAEDGIHGRELWSTDGTAEGTEMVADVCPGYCFGWAAYLTVVGDRLYFYGDDGAHGGELWTSDGTAEGTQLVADIVPGIESSSPIWLTTSGDRLFFVARDPEHGVEPWVSDGTAAGTDRVADLVPGAGDSDPDRLTALPGGIFFTADDGVHGREPWFSDGTAGGTQLLGDLRTGGDGSSPYPVQALLAPTFRDWARLGHLVVFTARDDQHGQELWSSDGTPAGTALLADLADDGPAGGSDPRAFTEWNGRLYFSTETPDKGGELWVTDGISDTHVVSELIAGNPASRTAATPLGTAGGWLYFSGYTDATGAELWRTDGTSANTHMVVDADPGPGSGLAWSVLARGAALGSRFLYYSANPAVGIEPWITDGTAEGTHTLRDIYSGTGWSNPLIFVEFAVLGDRILFFALDLLHGYEPWITDGTQAGTRPLADLDSQTSALLPCFWFHCNSVGAVGDRLFAGLHDPQSGEEPWVSAGTPGTTRLTADLRPATIQGFAESSFPWGFAGVGDTALFSAQTGDDSLGSAPSELWRSDGSEEGTWKIPGPEDAYHFTPALDAVFFQASTPEAGSELWISDGSATGTRMVADVQTGPEGSGPEEMTEAIGRVFFRAWDDDAGWELWASGGSEAGTARVADLWPGTGSSAPHALAANGGAHLFFSAETPGAGRELCVTDGTEAGTRRVIDLLPGAKDGIKIDSQPGLVALPQIAAGNGGAFFLGEDGVHGTEPWWTDGSEAGTRSLGDLRPGPASSRPRFLTTLGDRAFFAADDGAQGRELWTSDGTAAGTRMVLDLVPGEESSLPQWLTPADGVLYFAAHRPDVGLELWRTDGTEAGTELVADVYPGPEPSTPEFLTVAGRRLFFTANDGEHGFEPWALLLPARLPRLSLAANGGAVRGGEVELTARLYNPPPVAMPDADGDELVLPLPSELAYLGGEATSGDLAFEAAAAAAVSGRLTAAAAPSGLVTWNGALAAGASVTVTVRARILPSVLPGTSFSLWAEGHLDTDEDGSGDHLFNSDDPVLPGDDDPTAIIVEPLGLDVPALHPAALLLLAAALGALALRRLGGGT
jgi:ELWxxDGT repeat protein